MQKTCREDAGAAGEQLEAGASINCCGKRGASGHDHDPNKNLCMAAERGQNVLLCVPKKTDGILHVATKQGAMSYCATVSCSTQQHEQGSSVQRAPLPPRYLPNWASCPPSLAPSGSWNRRSPKNEELKADFVAVMDG
jgi:hypothetical protein